MDEKKNLVEKEEKRGDEKKTKVDKLLAHKIQVEDEEMKFNHNNYWTSCCLKMDKRAVAYFSQLGISAGICAFTIAMMAYNQDCDTFSRYSPLLTLIVGVWLPQPRMKTGE